MIFSFDVETNIVDGSASPFHKDTRIVLAPAAPADTPTVVCGHNLAFDMLHALKDKTYAPWARGVLFDKDVLLWDTMIVDYLISGCRYRSPTLEETAVRWGVPFVKDNLIAKYFDEGKGADVIIADGHSARLERYHDADLRATQHVANAQLAWCGHPDNARMFAVIRVQMRALKYIILEQLTGLPIDQVELTSRLTSAQQEVALLDAELNDLVKLGPVFNPQSNAHVAAVLFGGGIVEERRVQVGVYGPKAQRAGQPRYKRDDVLHTLPQRIVLTTDNSSVDEDHLQAIQADTGDDWVKQFVTLVLNRRALIKTIGTYFEPIQARVAESFDGRLHGDINMAIANTGRKSSSKPNLQNLPDPVRYVIRARDGYVIVTADFKQLEVVAWAYQSQDKQLYADLLAGKDIHSETSADVLRRTGIEPKRTDVKRVNFGRIYGGGVKTLSAQSGVEVAAVTPIVKALDTRYPDGKQFKERVNEALWKVAVPFSDPESGLPHSEAMYTTPSGRRLWFRTYPEQPKPWLKHQRLTDFSYTQCANRPVQSFATADIVPLAEAMVMSEFRKLGWGILDHIKPMLSVHDELVFECKISHLDELRNLLRRVESNLVPALNKQFMLDPPFDLPLKIEIGVGPSWAEAKS